MSLLLELFINYIIQIIQCSLDNQLFLGELFLIYLLFTTNKSGTTRFSLTTKSLDYCIGTFQVANRDTISTVLNSSISGASSGEYENASYTAGNFINIDN